MTSLLVESYASPSRLIQGYAELVRRGLTPRGLLFLALDSAGTVHLATPADGDEMTRMKVGHKLALEWPLPGRFFHYDSIHRLGSGFCVFNGDRRLHHPGDAVDVALVTAGFLKHSTAPNVFFGCNPHHPGAWLARGRDQVVALHDMGFVEVVPVPQGLLARRTLEPHLYLLPSERTAEAGVLASWERVYSSPLGNLLLVERRVVGERLVLTAEGGLVEVELAQLPLVTERARVPMKSGYAVVGRVDGSAFAITRGTPTEWGFENLHPAVLVGAEGNSLAALGHALSVAASPTAT